MQPRPEGPPSGTVTFLFSDIEGSTKLVERFGAGWPELLQRHRAALRGAFADHGGWEHATEGDSFFVAFTSAADAVKAAASGQRALAAEAWPTDGEIRVRMGLHTGDGRLSGGDYVGLDVHRAARIGAAGHGGQVVVSESTAALVQGSLPTGCRLVDLGLHRLKDMPRPERLHQLAIEGLRSEFPALRSLGARASNLPVALSSLVGRDADIEAVNGLLATSRLVTVTGPGGTGKTRLVQELARRNAEIYPNGATFVPLEALRDADLIPVEILRALRLDIAAATPPRERVIEALADQEALLVLDNLEQLAEAGPVIADLLGSIPGLRVLASSQAALHVAGEQEYGLAPLPDSAAVVLFVERARSVLPEFGLTDETRPTVTAICERLDGLPLAIELAAAQVRVLAPAAILARITDRLDALGSRRGDLPERQRTLRATVTWSYDLLAEAEQALFRRLSVFIGGATIADIEAFEACRGRSADPLSTLDALVDRSLVVVRRPAAEEHRFALLDTIRSVARELLHEAGEESEALDDFGRVFRALAANAEPELYGGHRRAWLDRLAAEHDNLRAALDHVAGTGDIASALDIAANLWRFWQTRGHLLEARDRLEGLLGMAADQSDLDPALMSRAEEAAGGVNYWMRSVAEDQVEPHYQRSLEFARQAGDKRREAWALYNLAFVYDFVAMTQHPDTADPERALELRRAALETFREIGDRRGIGESLWALGGNSIVMRADPVPSRAYLTEATQVLAEIGDSYGAAWAWTSIGMLDSLSGDLESARTAMLNGAELFLRDDDVPGQILTIQGLGSLAARAGDDRTAVRLGAAAEALARQIGVDPPLIAIIHDPLEAAKARLSPEEIAIEVDAATAIEARPFLEAALAERMTPAGTSRQ